MADKFHISDDGMPGKCKAQSQDSCPKTQAGDSFHGTLEEATKESQKRFEEKLGAFVTATKSTPAEDPAERVAKAQARVDKLTGPLDPRTSKATIAVIEHQRAEAQDELNAATAAAKVSRDEVYVHPQGKIIRVDADGNVRAFKDGKELSTSATAEKLRAGYGAWKLDTTAAAPASAPAAPPVVNALTPQEEDELVESYDSKIAAAKAAQTESAAAYRKLMDDQKEYDSLHGAAEGRAYYYDYSKGMGRVKGVNPNGRTMFDLSDEQKEAREKLRKASEAAHKLETDAQTELEKAGLGHRIPDEGNTIRVRTQAQKWLLKDELQGQISDGHWENSSGNPWEDWSGAKVVVDPRNPGRNFNTTKDNYQLNAKALLDVVGERMVENVQTKTETPDYDEKKMGADLADLRKIFKTKRAPVTGD